MDKLEARFGRFAMPGILKAVAGFQVLVYVLVAFTTSGSTVADSSFYSLLTLDRESVLSGQVWRLFTFIFLPINTNPLWVAISALFLVFINNAIESEWGSFKLNAFVLLGMLFVAGGVVFLGGWPTGLYLFSVFILAAAVLHPEQEILLMLIIPVKLKWVGVFTFATMVLAFLGSPAPIQVTIFLSFANFLLFFGPETLRKMKHRGEVTERRRRFQSVLPDEEDAFHVCIGCGKTDVADPEEEFRVAGDGEEYCSGCRPGQEENATDPG